MATAQELLDKVMAASRTLDEAKAKATAQKKLADAAAKRLTSLHGEVALAEKSLADARAELEKVMPKSK